MSIVTDTPEAPPKPAPAPIKITTPLYRGVTVDTRYVPSSALMTQIEGSPWTTDGYYSQKIDIDNKLAGQRINSSAIYQQYVLIKNMELRVTSPLSSVQNPESNAFDVVGTANVFPFLIPNVGDMFRANIGDGRLGVFQVTRSEQKSIFKEACFEIDYKLIDYDDYERMADLNTKVVQTVVYVRDFLMHGQNPLLFEEDYVLIQELWERYEYITKDYFRTFFSDEYKTLLMPGQGKPIYDHFLVSTLRKCFNTDQADELLHLRVMNLDDDQNMRTRQFWEMLFTCEKELMPLLADEMGLADARSFTRDPMMEGIYHTGIRYVVYPKNPVLPVDYGIRPIGIPLALEEIQEAPSQTRRLKDPLPTLDLPGLPTSHTSAPLIHKVKVDSFYVLSQNFYDELDKGQSLLELCVQDYLHGRNIPVRVLLEFCKSYRSWGGLEVYYYVPIVLILIKASIRSM